MKISTSINISFSRKRKLSHAARRMNVTVSDILSALMIRSRQHYDQIAACLWQTTDYQPDSFFEGEEYTIMHVRLDPVCYEYGVSERIIFKSSVSLIFRVAIDLFLDDLVRNGLDLPDNDMEICTNYTSFQYSIDYKCDEKKEYWTIHWTKRINNRKMKKIKSRRKKKKKNKQKNE